MKSAIYLLVTASFILAIIELASSYRDPLIASHRDPNAIYYHGKIVGCVTGFHPELPAGPLFDKLTPGIIDACPEE